MVTECVCCEEILEDRYYVHDGYIHCFSCLLEVTQSQEVIV